MDDVRANLKKNPENRAGTPPFSWSEFFWLCPSSGIRSMHDNNWCQICHCNPIFTHPLHPLKSKYVSTTLFRLYWEQESAVPEDHNMLEVMGKRLSPCWVKTFHEWCAIPRLNVAECPIFDTRSNFLMSLFANSQMILGRSLEQELTFLLFEHSFLL